MHLIRIQFASQCTRITIDVEHTEDGTHVNDKVLLQNPFDSMHWIASRSHMLKRPTFQPNHYTVRLGCNHLSESWSFRNWIFNSQTHTQICRICFWLLIIASGSTVHPNECVNCRWLLFNMNTKFRINTFTVWFTTHKSSFKPCSIVRTTIQLALEFRCTQNILIAFLTRHCHA